MVERDCAGAAAQQHQQHRDPLDMRRPSLRIDENLDYGCHAKEDQCRKPGEQSEDEQHRRGHLDGEREIGGQRRLQQRNVILVGE